MLKTGRQYPLTFRLYHTSFNPFGACNAHVFYACHADDGAHPGHRGGVFDVRAAHVYIHAAAVKDGVAHLSPDNWKPLIMCIRVALLSNVEDCFSYRLRFGKKILSIYWGKWS